MSPDIEWHVGEEAEHEIIARTSHVNRSRRSLWAVISAIGLGVSLGLLYRSIPEPVAQLIGPAPAPMLFASPTSPLHSTVPLSDTIAREADALSHGDQQQFATLLDPAEQSWLQEQLTAFESWGTPPPGEPLYMVADSETLPNEQAWAEVIQYRNGHFFRQMRFYRLAENRAGWLQTPPLSDAAIWGRAPVEVNPTEHFVVTSAERDAFAAWEMARQFEQLYAEACNVLGCWTLQPASRYFTLAMAPDTDYASLYTDDRARHVTVTLPSPLILGIYQSRALDPDVQPDDRITDYFDRFVYPWMVYITSGGFERWSQNRDGLILVWAISNWGQERLGRAPRPALPWSAELANRLKQLPLDAVWVWPDPTAEDDHYLSQAQATILIQLIDQHYGSDKVMALFRAIRAADSLSAALDAGGLTYADLVILWNDWLKRSVRS